MKTKLFILILFTASAILTKAQPSIPNFNFEQWEGSPEYPLGWTTNSAIYPPAAIVTKNAGDGHAGNTSVKMAVQNFDSNTVVSGTLASGFSIVPIDPSVFHVWVKMNLHTNDDFVIDLIGTNSGVKVSGNTQHFSNVIYAVWTKLDIAMSDVTPGQASDSIHIGFRFDVAPDTTSYVLIDDVSFDDGETGINDATALDGISLQTMYPNPSNTMSNLIYKLNERAAISLDVMDVLGNKVQHVFTEKQSAGTYRAEIETSSLPSGVYIAMLNVDGKNVQQHFMVQH